MRAWINLIEDAHSHDFLNDVLYHGTKSEFDDFDLAKNVTARHIYTSPDINTALFYGPIVYECRVRGPQIDITGTDSTSEEGWKVLHELAETYAENHEEELKHGDPSWGEPYARVHDAKHATIERLKKENAEDEDYDDLDAEWGAEDDPAFKAVLRKEAASLALEAIVNGELYKTSSHVQDSVLDEVFAMGYSSVAFTDPSSEGQSLSVVVQSPEDIRIFGRVR